MSITKNMNMNTSTGIASTIMIRHGSMTVGVDPC
jgi:hypothetical protein